MNTPEKNAKLKLQKAFKAWKALHPKARACYRITPASDYGRRGMPDGYVVLNGIHIDVEVKAGTNRLSKSQSVWLSETWAAGGVAMTVWGDDPADVALFFSELERIAVITECLDVSMVKYVKRVIQHG